MSSLSDCSTRHDAPAMAKLFEIRRMRKTLRRAGRPGMDRMAHAARSTRAAPVQIRVSTSRTSALRRSRSIHRRATTPLDAQEQEHAALDRAAQRLLDGDRVGRALQPVARRRPRRGRRRPARRRSCSRPR